MYKIFDAGGGGSKIPAYFIYYINFPCLSAYFMNGPQTMIHLFAPERFRNLKNSYSCRLWHVRIQFAFYKKSFLSDLTPKKSNSGHITCEITLKVNWGLEGTLDIMVTPILGVAFILFYGSTLLYKDGSTWSGSIAILRLQATRTEYCDLCIIKLNRKMDATPSFGITMIYIRSAF